MSCSLRSVDFVEGVEHCSPDLANRTRHACAGKTVLQKTTVVLLLFMLLFVQLPVNACGPFFDSPDFVYTLHPDIPLSKFAQGNIGVLPPTVARSYLVVAWRYLSGAPLSAAEQKSILSLWDTRLSRSGSEDIGDGSKWTAWREKMGAKNINVYSYKSLSDGDLYSSYLNCPSSAFDFALKTAEDVTRLFGATSSELKDWAAAQDKVFCNCNGDKPEIPAAVPSGMNAKLKEYRDYQIACANFYGGNFSVARQQFEKIAQDKDSPFNAYGAYLALRTLVREATVKAKVDTALLATASKQLQEMLNDKSKASLQSGLKDLQAFVKFKLEPDATFNRLSNALSSSAEGAEAGNNLCDYTFLFSNVLSDQMSDPTEVTAAACKARWALHDRIQKAGELSDWILVMQCPDNVEAQKYAVAKWKQSHKLQWLVAALHLSKAKDADTAALIEDAKKITASSPAYVNLQYEIALHLYAAGKTDAARSMVEAILQNKSLDLGPSSKNYFIGLRMKLCKNFAEFLSFAPQRPCCIEEGGDAFELPADYEKINGAKEWKMYEPCFSAATCRFYSYAVPVSLLTTIADAPLPKRLKEDAVQSAFVRSFLLGDAKALSAVSSKMSALGPAIASLVADYVKASNPVEKNFAGAFLLLRNPGMRPYITYNYGRRTPINKIDDYQDNYWNQVEFKAPDTKDDMLFLNKDATEYASCLSVKEKAEGLAENKKIRELGFAPAALSKFVLAYVKQNPKDPRIPEALHLCVKATHFGEQDTNTSKLSKECFGVLHKQYAKSPWTAKTPYYY